jgi:hypothetical protein
MSKKKSNLNKNLHESSKKIGDFILNITNSKNNKFDNKDFLPHLCNILLVIIVLSMLLKYFFYNNINNSFCSRLDNLNVCSVKNIKINSDNNIDFECKKNNFELLIFNKIGLGKKKLIFSLLFIITIISFVLIYILYILNSNLYLKILFLITTGLFILLTLIVYIINTVKLKRIRNILNEIEKGNFEDNGSIEYKKSNDLLKKYRESGDKVNIKLNKVYMILASILIIIVLIMMFINMTNDIFQESLLFGIFIILSILFITFIGKSNTNNFNNTFSNFFINILSTFKILLITAFIVLYVIALGDNISNILRPTTVLFIIISLLVIIYVVKLNILKKKCANKDYKCVSGMNKVSESKVNNSAKYKLKCYSDIMISDDKYNEIKVYNKYIIGLSSTLFIILYFQWILK